VIPLFAFVRVNGGRRFQLLVPLFLIWLLLLPFLLLALPFLLLLALGAPVRTWRGARALLSLLCAAHGTRVEMTSPHRSLLVHVW
jgi:hypothetical protein